jgi:hypothetical protein
MKSKRAEFRAETKRQAHMRSGGICEAIGEDYGMPPGVRCTTSLALGVEYDHSRVEAALGGSADLDNCLAVCPSCHRYRTTARQPALAKAKRLADKQMKARDKPREEKPRKPLVPEKVTGIGMPGLARRYRRKD